MIIVGEGNFFEKVSFPHTPILSKLPPKRILKAFL
jgi:hypothetical protein